MLPTWAPPNRTRATDRRRDKAAHRMDWCQLRGRIAVAAATLAPVAVLLKVAGLASFVQTSVITRILYNHRVFNALSA